MSKPKTAKELAPKPVERDIRISFAIAWFLSEEDAAAFAAAYPSTYNGGWSHGAKTGRDKSWDKTTPEGVKHYAVTY